MAKFVTKKQLSERFSQKSPREVPQPWTCMKCPREKKATKRWPKPADGVCSKCRISAREKVVRQKLRLMPIMLNETQKLLQELGEAVSWDTLRWSLKQPEKLEAIMKQNKECLESLSIIKPKLFVPPTPPAPKKVLDTQTSGWGEGVKRPE